MKTPIKPEIEFNKNCSVRKAIEIIGMKYAILIFNELLKHETLRFGQMRKVLGNINTRTLTTTLKELERVELVARKQYAEIPPKVEYSLTKKGKDLKKVLIQLQVWYDKSYKG